MIRFRIAGQKIQISHEIVWSYSQCNNIHTAVLQFKGRYPEFIVWLPGHQYDNNSCLGRIEQLWFFFCFVQCFSHIGHDAHSVTKCTQSLSKISKIGWIARSGHKMCIGWIRDDSNILIEESGCYGYDKLQLKDNIIVAIVAWGVDQENNGCILATV